MREKNKPKKEERCAMQFLSINWSMLSWSPSSNPQFLPIPPSLYTGHDVESLFGQFLSAALQLLVLVGRAWNSKQSFS